MNLSDGALRISLTLVFEQEVLGVLILPVGHQADLYDISDGTVDVDLPRSPCTDRLTLRRGGLFDDGVNMAHLVSGGLDCPTEIQKCDPDRLTWSCLYQPGAVQGTEVGASSDCTGQVAKRLGHSDVVIGLAQVSPS